MKTIWKIQLNLVERQSIGLPEGWKFLSIQLQDTSICAWFLVDEYTDHIALHTISMVGTGGQVSPGIGGYLGTVQKDKYVWHFFIVGGSRE